MRKLRLSHSLIFVNNIITEVDTVYKDIKINFTKNYKHRINIILSICLPIDRLKTKMRWLKVAKNFNISNFSL